ncbi:MAG: AraC family transcriptional regulator [Lentisphaeria bacterium]
MNNFYFRLESLPRLTGLVPHVKLLSHSDSDVQAKSAVCREKINFGLIWHSLEGTASYEIAGREYRVPVPALAFLYPGLPCRQTTIKCTKTIISYDRKYLDHFRWFTAKEERILTPIKMNQEIIDAAKELHGLCANINRTGNADRVDFLASYLINQCVLASVLGESDPLEDKIRSIASFLNLHSREKVDIPTLTRKYGFSDSTFRRFWKRVFANVTPVEYVIGLRMEEAKHLLRESELPLAEISRIIGVEDPFYFSRLFRSRVGISPSNWRKADKH